MTTIETAAPMSQAAYDELYNQAVTMHLYGNKNAYEIKSYLLDRGMDEPNADAIIDNIEGQIKTARRNTAQKDMLFGALWCIGGTVLTLMDIGFIFWGAIIFGAVQFVKGASNL